METLWLIFVIVAAGAITRKVLNRRIKENYKNIIYVYQCTRCESYFSLTRLKGVDPRCPYDNAVCRKVEYDAP